MNKPKMPLFGDSISGGYAPSVIEQMPDRAEIAGIPVNDLYAIIIEADPEECLKADGVHMTEKGNEVLAPAVIATINKAVQA